MEDMPKKKKPQTKGSGRPKPLTPKTGFTKSKRRYDNGGKIKK